jgi:hypothetical protein
MTSAPWQLTSSLPLVSDALAALQLPTPRPIPSELVAFRTAIEGTLLATLQIPDVTLTHDWLSPGQPDWYDVRRGLYRIYEVLEEAAARVDGWVEQTATRPTQAGRILAQANVARWDLHALLLPLTTADLDRSPGGGEWTLRETIAHIVIAQALYTLTTAYWAHQQRAAGVPLVPPELPFDRLPTPEWSDGTLADLRQRLDTLLDLGIGFLVHLDDPAELDKLALWYSYEVTVRFRLHRFAAHLREHTIQVEKTLAMLGREPTEVERISRISLGAYGNLEGSLLGLPADAFDRPMGEAMSLANYLAGVAERVATIATEVGAASHG